jgi:hypothetical protein
MLHIDFMVFTAAYNREPYLALVLVTATQGDLAADDTSVGLEPGRRPRAGAGLSDLSTHTPVNRSAWPPAPPRPSPGGRSP